MHWKLPRPLKKIKNKQPQKVWVDDGTEFLGAFKTLCNKQKVHLYSTFSEKKSAFAERNIRSLKTLSTSTLKKSGHTPTLINWINL